MIFTGFDGYLSCAPGLRACRVRGRRCPDLSNRSLHGSFVPVSDSLTVTAGQPAFAPCRLCEASFTVKNTTSASTVALAECTTFDGT